MTDDGKPDDKVKEPPKDTKSKDEFEQRERRAGDEPAEATRSTSTSNGSGEPLAPTAGEGKDEAAAPAIAEADKQNELKRSAVRRWVTYIVIYTYCGLGSLLVLWLLWAGRVELALGVFGGIAGTAGAITGFWFGSRGTTPAQVSAAGGG